MSFVGLVIAYAGSPSNIPPGYLLCDGSLYEKSQYPKLFDVIGHSFGQTDEDKFYVPDLRGRFVRGVDLNAGHDPDSGKRVDSRDPERVAGDVVGSLQQDALQEHQHNYRIFPGARGGIASGTYWEGGDAVTSGISNGTRTSSETRPLNVYLHYLIQCA